jgi:hypothetical protein
MTTQHQWKKTDGTKPKLSEKKVSQNLFVNHKTLTWFPTNTRQRGRKASDWPSKPWNGNHAIHYETD